ncbi:MAG: lysine--tRNA ligase [Candidatus Hodarchaeales archaeon]
MNESETNRFWADYIVEELRKKAENNPDLNKIVQERGYIVYDEKTPSGRIHIGPGRGWVIHDVVARALRSAGLKGRFILSSDDMDPLDDIPPYLDAEVYKKYMGIPMRELPSPDGSSKSFADYYFHEATGKFDEYGIEAELESTGDRYFNGDFDWAIKKALDNKDIIDSIYRQFYGKAPNKLPFNPVCENCGRIGTTRAYEWNSDSELVKYECATDLVKWAEGCGHKGEISPYGGNGKLPWKVEWAAKWPTVGVIYEIAGKDHFSKGGSRSISIRICDQVYNYPPPYPSTPTSTGKGHEFFTIEGKKMSTSKGSGMSFAEMTEYAPGRILKYLFVRTRPQSAIEFNIQGTDKLLSLYDEYDRTERIYYGLEEGISDKERSKQRRLYELSRVGKIPERIPPQVAFSYCVTLVQVTASIDEAVKRLIETGHVEKNLEEWELQVVTARLKAAAKFVKTHAPERLRIRLAEPRKMDLDDKELSVLQDFAGLLSGKLDEEEMKEKMGQIMRENGIKARAMFKLLYETITGKSRGPRLVPFINAIGPGKVKEIIEKTIELSRD